MGPSATASSVPASAGAMLVTGWQRGEWEPEGGEGERRRCPKEKRAGHEEGRTGGDQLCQIQNFMLGLMA